MTNGTGLPDPTPRARIIVGILLLAALAAAIGADVFDWTTNEFKPAENKEANFALFAGFFVAAQVLERLIEAISPLVPPWKRTTATNAAEAAERQADRALVMLGLAVMLGVLVSAILGLYFLEAIGIDAPIWVDLLATGLTISGGTKSLHDLIKAIERAKTPTPA